FKAKGCVASMAAASAIAEMLQGKRLAEAGQIRREHVVSALGGLSAESMHVSHLAMEAAVKLIAQARAS
ncbi:MAG: iron-sulfur cluster assembly scaffold protein, partial [Chthoniobacterales bacterium]